MAEIVATEPPKYNPVRAGQPGGPNLAWGRPASRTIGGNVLGLPRTPHRHGDRDRNRDEPARCRDRAPLKEDAGRISVVEVPPPEERWRDIDGKPSPKFEPWPAELGLEAQSPGRPLGCSPHGDEHNGQDDGDLAPEDPRGRHVMSSNEQNPFEEKNARS